MPHRPHFNLLSVHKYFSQNLPMCQLFGTPFSSFLSQNIPLIRAWRIGCFLCKCSLLDLRALEPGTDRKCDSFCKFILSRPWKVIINKPSPRSHFSVVRTLTRANIPYHFRIVMNKHGKSLTLCDIPCTQW